MKYVGYSNKLNYLSKSLLMCFALFQAFPCISAEKPTLSSFAKIIKYCQFGEEGVIQKIFEIIGTKSKICIEVGASEGFFLSNTALLWTTQGWKGILIEGSQHGFNQLVANVKPYNCVPVCAYIGNEPSNSLETLLKSHLTGDEIDLFSLDIDGNDYYIFESLNKFRPRVIICEFNPTLPFHIDMYGAYNNYIGCSVRALIRIAESKRYKLIAIVGANAFFVVEEEYNKFSDFETSFEKLRVDDSLMYIVTAFDGQYFIIRGKNESKGDFGITLPYQGKVYGSYEKLPYLLIRSSL
jgi:hypothetical protein